jgi:hypothetical protein
MKPNLPSFGAEAKDFFPPLSDGAEVTLKLLGTPEVYESLYGEKIRLEVKVIGMNEKSPEELKLMNEYIVSSSALCWREIHKAWDKLNYFDFNWNLTCDKTDDKTMYKLRAMKPEK